jgi:hypothetical protein
MPMMLMMSMKFAHVGVVAMSFSSVITRATGRRRIGCFFYKFCAMVVIVLVIVNVIKFQPLFLCNVEQIGTDLLSRMGTFVPLFATQELFQMLPQFG